MLGPSNRGIRAIAVGLAAMIGAGGCIFDPFGRRLRQAQDEVAGLDQRVGSLERATLVGSSLAAPSNELPAEALPQSLASAGPRASVPRSSQWPGLPIDWRRAIGKLLRGVVNVITGWVEIPKRVHETTETSGAGTGFTWGLLRGLGYGFVRTAAGAYDTVTFLVPAPPGYQPVMQPPYVFVCDAGEPRPSAEEEGSFSDSVICPIGGEPVPSKYRYCPQHGVELNAR